MDITDLESFKNNNINFEISTEEYSQIGSNLVKLKDDIEKEINNINQLYDKTIKDITNSFIKKHENLVYEENNLKERLENEVKRKKDQLKSYLSQTNHQIKLNERIKKGAEKIRKEEENIVVTLFYVSVINKSRIGMKSLLDIPMKTINFYYKEDKNNFILEEFCFNKDDSLNNMSNINNNNFNRNKLISFNS